MYLLGTMNPKGGRRTQKESVPDEVPLQTWEVDFMERKLMVFGYKYLLVFIATVCCSSACLTAAPESNDRLTTACVLQPPQPAPCHSDCILGGFPILPELVQPWQPNVDFNLVPIILFINKA